MQNKEKKSKVKKIISSIVVFIVLIIGGISSGKISSLEDVINFIKTHLTPQSSSEREPAVCNPYEDDCSKFYAESGSSFLNGNKNLKAVVLLSKDNYLTMLKKIKTQEPDEKAEYSRKEWKHWIGSPCNTRQTVLKEQGSKVKIGARCSIESGFWIDPYLLEEYHEAKLDIDHVIPLGYAAKHGAKTWSASKKEQFANDYSHLLAVNLSENRKKGDAGPKDYMPPKNRCLYAKIWVHTLNKYKLSTSKEDKKVLEKALKSCEF